MATIAVTISPPPDQPLAWQSEGLRFNAYGAHLRRQFGGRVQRVSIDAGFTCPNVDGAVARGGCNFCDNRSFSPSRRVRLRQVRDQLAAGIQSVRRRYQAVSGFIVYFQPATNTYGAIDELRELYQLGLSMSDEVVGIAIGTRPDCVPNSVLAVLGQLAAESFVSLEFGMQTIHDESLRWMNRAHTHADMINAIDRCRGFGIETCAHIILGIPGESPAMMMDTAESIGVLGFDSIKLHNLYAVGGTPLGDQVVAGAVKLMERRPYIETVVDFLERIPPHVVVERVSGDAPSEYLIAPQWCLDKSGLRVEIDQEFSKRGTRQGSHYVAPSVPPPQRPVPRDETPQAIRDRIEHQRRLPVLKLEQSTQTEVT